MDHVDPVIMLTFCLKMKAASSNIQQISRTEGQQSDRKLESEG